jgi:hypothetical protein
MYQECKKCRGLGLGYKSTGHWGYAMFICDDCAGRGFLCDEAEHLRRIRQIIEEIAKIPGHVGGRQGD